MDAAQISFASKGIGDLAIAHRVDVDPLTGGAVINVFLPVTPGRAGFGPSLTLQYNSSAGNSIYGVGWSLTGLPIIGLSSQQLPKYDGNDQFIFNGTDDLVPVLRRNGTTWEPKIDEQAEFWVHYYRARVERSYLRFEKWVQKTTGRVHWRSRNRDDVVAIYGLDTSGDSRISDPSAPSRTYAWLVEAQYDGAGNAICYEYAPENADDLDIGRTCERHRILQGNAFTQRYPKRILYGNTKPFRANEVISTEHKWLFEVVFDYGDHADHPVPTPEPIQPWPVRLDPYSNYQPGFEVRTYRLCRRVLMFHHFPEELGAEATLVGATTLEHGEHAAGSTLQAIRYTGFRREADTGHISQKSLPPLQFEYAMPSMGQDFRTAPEQTKENCPYGFGDTRYRWIDVFGEGLPGILTETNQAWYYKPNLGGGRFGPQQKVAEKPSQRVGSYALTDFDRDGNLNLVVLEGRQAGYFEYDRDTTQWRGFRPFLSAPHIDAIGMKAQWLDLNGDGLLDILISGQDRFTWYPSQGKDGFGEPIEFAKPRATTQTQTITEDPNLDLFFVDMTGDGLLDQGRIQNGRVEYWPQLGNGRFGDSVVMENAPVFDFDREFDPRRLRLVDLDGSGTTDLLYIGRGEVRYWINAGGNCFIEGGCLTDLPYIDNLSTVQVLDFLGDGTPCLVWSSPLASYAEAPIHYLRLTNGVTPRLLLRVNNSMGQEVRLHYSSSGQHYLRDKKVGRGWISKLPSHTTVVDKKEVIDHISGSHSVSRYEYHDGYFDSEKRVFRGFGLVEQYDAELFDRASMLETQYTASACIRTWFHNGAFGWDTRRVQDYYDRDPAHALLPLPACEDLEKIRPEEFLDGYRALAGQILRQEVFGVGANGRRAEHPYQVTQVTYRLRRLQPALGGQDACFAVYQSERLLHDYEQRPDDPRVTQQFTLAVDPYGNVETECTVAYQRRQTVADAITAQRRDSISVSHHAYINVDETERYELGIPLENKGFELSGVRPEPGPLFRLDDLESGLGAALATPLEFHESLDAAAVSPQVRLVDWTRTYYWTDEATAALPLGQVGRQALLHHEESACFNTALIEEVFGGRVGADLLRSHGRYLWADGYWWKPGPVQHYLTADGFYSLTKEERADSGTTSYTYDEPHFLTLTAVRDALDNCTRADAIDYHLIAPACITDANNNVAEVLYDPLGVVIVSSSQGNVLGAGGTAEVYGNDRLSAYTLQPDANVARILAEPARFLQHAGQFCYYELDTWETSRLPLCSLSLIREEFVHNGRGGGSPDSRLQIRLTYTDGFGRTLQSKQLIEPGSAIRRDSTGHIVLDERGRPAEEPVQERWLVCGHTVYNNKQRPVRQYEPFYSAISDFEADAELQSYGVSTYSHYDPIGRLIQVDLPNGTFSKVETTAWEIRRSDPNDTVKESVYKIVRQLLPDANPEKQALRKAQVHADTPSLVRLDPLGREIVQTETDSDGTTRETESQLDIRGDAAAVIDPRGLAAFRYRRDMLRRVLHEYSADAGTTWRLPDVLDRTLHQWDDRGVHQHCEYDVLGRPIAVLVEGALGLNQVTERMVYGEDPRVTHAELKNARGRLVTHYDQAGVLTIEQYEPSGNPLLSERQFLQDYKTEPNWIDPAAVTLEAFRFTTTTTYDALGRIREQRLPDGTTRRLDYLSSGGIDRVRVTTADEALIDVAFLTESTFNARGQRTRSLLGNGVEITYAYDRETFRLQRLTARRPASASGGARLYQDIEYTYDPVGNITYCVDHAQQPAPSPAQVLEGLRVSPHCEFTYDAFYQLRRATGRMHQALLPHDYRGEVRESGALKGTRHLSLTNGAAVERYSRTYEYDRSGNIHYMRHQGLSRNWTTEIWTSSTSNRSLPATDPAGVPVTDPESRFDAKGNCIFMPHLRALEWNYRNTLSRAVFVDRSADGQPDDAEYYVYGNDGIRLRKVHEKLVTDGQVEITEKIYLDGCEIKRVYRNGEPVLERTTSHITDGTNRIALLHQWTRDTRAHETDDITHKKIHYQLANHLGSSSLEVDERGAIINYEEYFPFGGTAFIAGNNLREVGLKEYRYCGKECDDNTSFYYYGYRYYAPWIGKWLSPDPVGPQKSLNLYQFVLNNPVKLIDPNGLGVITINGIEVPYTVVPFQQLPPRARVFGSPDQPIAVLSGTTRLPRLGEDLPASFVWFGSWAELATRAQEIQNPQLMVYLPGVEHPEAEQERQRMVEGLRGRSLQPMEVTVHPRIGEPLGHPGAEGSEGERPDPQASPPPAEREQTEPRVATPPEHEVQTPVGLSGLARPVEAAEEPQPTMLYHPRGHATRTPPSETGQVRSISEIFHVPPTFYAHLIPPTSSQPSPYLPPHLELPSAQGAEALFRSEERLLHRTRWMSSNLTFWVSEITAALAELISAPLALPGGPGGGSGEFAGAITGRLSRESTLRFGSREVGRVATSEAGDLGIVQTVRQWFRGRAERAMLARELHDAEEVLRVAQMPSRGPAAQTWSRSRIVSDLVGGDAAVVRQSARMARATGFSYRPLQRGALAGIDDATLVGHGVVENPTGGATLARLGRTYGDLSASDLARVLVEDLDWRGGTLRLPLCNTALRDPHGRVFAEELASELARRHAPTVVIAPRGGVNTVGGLPAVRPLPGGELLPTAAFQRGGWEYFGP